MVITSRHSNSEKENHTSSEWYTRSKIYKICNYSVKMLAEIAFRNVDTRVTLVLVLRNSLQKTTRKISLSVIEIK